MKLKAWKIGLFALGGLFTVVWVTSSAFAQSGYTDWGAWRFTWEVKDSAGLALRNVFYQNQQVIYKASFPVIRLKYKDNTCGPYQGQIGWNALQKIPTCAHDKVCQVSYSVNGRNWLELGVLSQVGEHRFYQVWYLSEDGYIRAAVWSHGLNCIAHQDQHVYWRIDFDINGADEDQVFVYETIRPDEGWGKFWHKYTDESDDLKNSAINRVWYVRNSQRGTGVWVMPGPDGAADSFSDKDIGARLYHYEEDEPWPFGVWGDLGYNNGENIEEKDVVFWYIAHLSRTATDRTDQWKWVGPLLFVHQ